MKVQKHSPRLKPIVVHIISGLGTGGAERSLYNIANSDLSQIYDFIFISLKGGGLYERKIIDLGHDLKILNLNKLNFFYKLIKLAFQLRKVRPEIIQGWMYHGNLVAAIMKLFTSQNTKLLFNVRHSLSSIKLEKPSTRLVIYLNKYLSRIANKVIFNSNSALAQHTKYGFSKMNSKFIGNGFVDSYKANQAKRSLIRNNLNFKKNEIVIGHVARLHPMKGHEIFIKSVINLINKNLNIKILMIGKGVNFSNIKFNSLIPHQYKQHFILLGEIENTQDYMEAMDIFCLSSLWGEGFPNVLGEAMLVELPCISTNIGDSAEVIGECGLIVDQPITEEKITNNLEQLVSLSKAELEQIGKKGRERIISNFTITKTLDQYQIIYKEVLE